MGEKRAPNNFLELATNGFLEQPTAAVAVLSF
jgi:hypothetical protein